MSRRAPLAAPAATVALAPRGGDCLTVMKVRQRALRRDPRCGDA